MSLLKDVILDLANTGVIEQDVTLNDRKFILRTVTTEEQILLETLANTASMKKKYDADEHMNTYADTMRKFRDLTLLSFAIKSIDGQEPIDTSLAPPLQLKGRLEFRDELSTLNPMMIDELLKGYNKMQDKSKEFYSDIKENLGK